MVELRDLLPSNPNSDEFVLPPGQTAADLVRWLLARQKEVFGTTVVERGDLPYVALRRNMRRLLETYPLDEVKRAIELSIWNGDHPASTKHIEEQIIWRRENNSLPPTLFEKQ